MSATSVRAVVQHVTRRIDGGDLDGALSGIFDFVERIITEPLCTGQVYGSPELDALCERIGSQSLARRPRVPVAAGIAGERPLYAYVVTRLQKSGGHTRVIEDFVRARPAALHLILATELCGRSDLEYVRQRLTSQPGVRFESAAVSGFARRLAWLQDALRQAAPAHTYLFNHHQDSVAVAALPADSGLAASFYHHGDHHLCLGVHLRHMAHIDPHPMGYRQCREHLGIDNVYAPLTVEDKGTRPEGLGFLSGAGLVTCTAARSNKVEIPYFVRYVDVVPALIEATGGTHVHVGTLSPWARWRIVRGLRRRGIPSERFEYVNWVPSVWRFLHERRVDMYVASFPYGGGLTLIEAMGAGVPVALHSHIHSRVLSGIDLAYPDAFVWHQPEELYRFCAGLTRERLEHDSREARRRYESFHRRDILEGLLAGDVPSMMPPPEGLSSRFVTRDDEWAAWAEGQLRISRLASRTAYRALRRIRARWSRG